MSKPTHPTDVTLWADPLCPWTWVAYKWLREAEAVRPLTLAVRPARPTARPEGTPSPCEESSRYRELAPGPTRVLAAVAAEHGDQTVRTLYEAVARRFHEAGGLYDGLHDMLRGLPRQAGEDVRAALLEQARDVVEKALADCGLPMGQADAMESAHWDDALHAAHPSARRDGRGTGPLSAPVISLGGTCVHGPLMRRAPAGERAGALWDAIAALTREDAFLELCRATPPG